jgi:hypothetical protein
MPLKRFGLVALATWLILGGSALAQHREPTTTTTTTTRTRVAEPASSLALLGLGLLWVGRLAQRRNRS